MGRLTLLAIAWVLGLPLGVSASLIQNGRFTEATGGVPTGWRIEAWSRDLTDVAWEAATDGRPNGSGLVRLVNRGANDARLCQTIPVVPGASYRVSARVKTQNVGLATAGALIAIEPRIADSVDVKGTQDWQLLEVTAASQDADSWDICLRLGSYANLNTGTAWFSDVRVDLMGGGAPAEGSRWSRFFLMPWLTSFRQASWLQTATPLAGGLLLALGLGIVGRRPR